eukprot:g262.t1
MYEHDGQRKHTTVGVLSGLTQTMLVCAIGPLLCLMVVRCLLAPSSLDDEDEVADDRMLTSLAYMSNRADLTYLGVVETLRDGASWGTPLRGKQKTPGSAQTGVAPASPSAVKATAPRDQQQEEEEKESEDPDTALAAANSKSLPTAPLREPSMSTVWTAPLREPSMSTVWTGPRGRPVPITPALTRTSTAVWGTGSDSDDTGIEAGQEAWAEPGNPQRVDRPNLTRMWTMASFRRGASSLSDEDNNTSQDNNAAAANLGLLGGLVSTVSGVFDWLGGIVVGAASMSPAAVSPVAKEDEEAAEEAEDEAGGEGTKVAVAAGAGSPHESGPHDT